MVDPQSDRIEVAGKAMPPEAQLRYYVLNKPIGVISTLSDPEGRRTVRDFMPSGVRLFPVGRLDADTSGLLVLTNDGELAHHLMHPRYGVEKVYRVWVDHPPTDNQLMRLRNGVEFEPGVVSAPARARTLEAEKGQGLIELAIHEGRYRQVRRMCEAIGLNVTGLHRWAYGPIKLGPVERGMWRELSQDEVDRLRSSSARPTTRNARRGEFFSARRGLVSSQSGAATGRGPRRAPFEPRPREERVAPGTGRRVSTPRGRTDRERPASAGPRREGAPRERFDRERPARGGPRREGASSERFDRARPASAGPRRESAPRGRGDRERPATGRPRREHPGRDESMYESRPQRPTHDFGSPARRQERAMDRISGRTPPRPPARASRPGRGDADSVRRYSRSESNRSEGQGAPPRTPSRGPSTRPSAGAPRGMSRGPSSRPSSGPPRGASSRPSAGAPRGMSRGPSSRPSSGSPRGASSRPSAGPSRGASSRPSGAPSRGASSRPAARPPRPFSRATSSRPDNSPGSRPFGAPPRGPSSRPSSGAPRGGARGPSSRTSSGPPRGPVGRPAGKRSQVGQKPRTGPTKGGSARPGCPSRPPRSR